jgi:outer membrane protein assembly factor BamB
MHTTRTMNRLLAGGIIGILVLEFIIPSAIAAVKTDSDDGVWIDSFDDTSNLKLNKYCEVKDGSIVLKKGSSAKSYSFALQNNHLAYFYDSFFFFPLWFSPEKHTGLETEFETPDIIKLKYKDNDWANQSSYRYSKCIIQHFRFQVDIDVNAVDYVNVIWKGRVSTGAKVKFYYWNASRNNLLGRWIILGSNLSSGTDISTELSIPGKAVKYAVDSDGYIDITVMAYYPLGFKTCTLSTDFVEVKAQTETGYVSGYGNAETRQAIDPKNISTKFSTFYWELLSWDDYQQGGAKARYQVLYENATGKYVEVEDTTLRGNHNGFTASPVFLNNLSNTDFHNKYKKLKILANLSTDSPTTSPRIFSWAVTWQNGARWQDTFNSSFRMDRQIKLNRENGTLVISSLQDEWPLFGFDSANTRASNGKGPKTNFTYWFSKEDVGGTFRNPIIANGKVYIFSKRLLHLYNVTVPTGSPEEYRQQNVLSIPFDYDLSNSPALTDEFAIIATGQQAKGGAQNHIYRYKIENKSLTLEWEDNNTEKISYAASPVIAENTIFISTWGGDNGSYISEKNRYTNNKLVAVSLDNGLWLWRYSLPAASYSTPAVTSDKVIVGCNSPDNESILAFSLDGAKIWGKKIGAIGYASPVIYEDTVFVTCKKVSGTTATTTIVALNLEDGTFLWNATLCELTTRYSNLADSTPAVYDGILYAASPDGKVYAIYTTNGTIRWSSSIYTIPSGSTSGLFFSPAYADDHIYIGTPSGTMYAINATNGKTTWQFTTYYTASIDGSAVVSNGLVFFADANGRLYSIGQFATSTEEVTGRIISIPIRLPEAYWWDTFYADVSYDSSISSIKFKLLDEDNTILQDNIANKTSLSAGDQLLDRTIRLRADFSSKNLSKNNPKLLRWYVTLTVDTQKPWLNSSSFRPDPNGWLPKIVPVFTIKVKDNNTGLRVNSAVYTLSYTLNNVSQKSTVPALCSGKNGTKDIQLLTMNISALPFYKNITALHSIMFNITDLAGNTASKTVTFKQDTKKPTSSIITKQMQKRYNTSFIYINATANDTGVLNVDASGIKLVELYYRYSQKNNFTGNWIYFANSTKTNPSWKFNFTNRQNQDGGYFELCTIAKDNANNNESFPSVGDVSFLYDWKAPSLPSYSGETLWFKERPTFSVSFEDDFRLDTIQYRPNFETIWTTIASRVNSSIYNADWSLKEEYWDFMAEDEVYYLYFNINDTLGNRLLVTSNAKAITIRKDTSSPSISIDTPVVSEEWVWTENFTVSGLGTDQNGSGIKDATLYYRFSEDKSNWSDWATYGQTLDYPHFEWDFNATKGDGYYEVKINVTDYAGNMGESDVFLIGVASFPTTLVAVMASLIVVLVLVSLIIFFKWRKKRTA